MKFKDHLKTFAVGCACVLFSEPIGMCFHIVGNVITKFGAFLQGLLF